MGDIVDIAMTLHRRDPALQGYSSVFDRLDDPGVAGRVRMRMVWPASKPVRWRETDGLPPPKVTKTADGTELVIDLTNVEAPKPPRGAPGRFVDLGSIEVSQYKDWAEFSRATFPLYDKAERIQPGSPLAAEVAKIAAASADPKVRALAALHLVEDQTRYVFLGMNDGGLVPADAEATWSRRFGDCKGKSVLLVAVLQALGIKAEPALVSTTLGDGLDQRLPWPAVRPRDHPGRDRWQGLLAGRHPRGRPRPGRPGRAAVPLGAAGARGRLRPGQAGAGAAYRAPVRRADGDRRVQGADRASADPDHLRLSRRERRGDASATGQRHARRYRARPARVLGQVLSMAGAVDRHHRGGSDRQCR